MDTPQRGRGRKSSSMHNGQPAASQEVVPSSTREIQLVAPQYAHLLREDNDGLVMPPALSAKKGSHGTSIALQANFFSLQTNWSWSVNLYRVNFNPDMGLTTTERKAMLRAHESTISQGYVFDGSVMYVRHVLHPSTVLYSVSNRESKQIKITFVKVGSFDSDSSSHNMQLFNIIMRKCLEDLQLKQVGRNFYDSNEAIEIPRFAFDIWPGYITSIRQHDSSVLLCMQVCHKIMRKDTAYTLYKTCVTESPNEGTDIFARAVVGTIVLTEFNNRTYRICDVDFNIGISSTFKMNNGDERTFEQYYRDRYNINLGDPIQPMLVSKAKKKLTRSGMSELIYLPSTLCRLTGITENMKSDFYMMQSLAHHTRISPEHRIEKLLKCNKRLLETPNVVDGLGIWNMRLSDKLVDVEGRLQPLEKIQFGNQNLVLPDQTVQWTTQLNSSRMYSPVHVDNWAVVHMQKDTCQVTKFVQFLIDASSRLGMNLSKPSQVPVAMDKIECWARTIDETVTGKSPVFIMCIVPNSNQVRYSAIKRLCCIDRPIPSQVVVLKNLSSKALGGITKKLIIQMNCKLGGAPWTLHVPCKDIMIVGYDVHHDSVQKNLSCSAFVATLNSTFTKYHSSTTRHLNGEELSNDMHVNVLVAAEKYRRLNGRLPKFIVIYRDGIGEGKVSYVVEHEVKIVRTALQEHYDLNAPRLAFIVISKRHNTRIFYDGKNPPPGTVVDNNITLLGQYDFFLVSQSVRQGTVSPTSYQIVYDSIHWSPDIFQRLTYKLTHLYFNWTGTVRVPAPAQYAHKLASLVGQFLKGSPPSQSLDELLYFL